MDQLVARRPARVRQHGTGPDNVPASFASWTKDCLRSLGAGQLTSSAAPADRFRFVSRCRALYEPAHAPAAPRQSAHLRESSSPPLSLSAPALWEALPQPFFARLWLCQMDSVEGACASLGRSAETSLALSLSLRHTRRRPLRFPPPERQLSGPQVASGCGSAGPIRCCSQGSAGSSRVSPPRIGKRAA